MQCPQCLSHNHKAAGFCDQCGAPLKPAEKGAQAAPPAAQGGRGVRLIMPTILGAVLGGVFVAVWYVTTQMATTDERRAPAAPESVAPREFTSRTVDSPAAPAEEISLPETAQPQPEETATTVQVQGSEERVLQVAQITIEDAWESRLAATPAAVVAGAWVVLPRRACLGGVKWNAKLSSGKSIAIEYSYWRTGSRIGL